MRILGCIVLASSTLCLAGCGIFAAPFLGRWNLLDPEQDPGIELVASEAGWVGETGSGDFDLPIMRVGMWGGEKWAALLSFDFSKLPQEIVSAQLDLYCAAESGTSFNVAVKVIQKPWAVGVTWAELIAPAFLSPQASPVVVLTAASIGKVLFDVTDLLRSYRSGSIAGLLLKAEPEVDIAQASFNSEDAPSAQPILRIWGY